MAKYLRRGSDWRVSSDADANYVDVLPVGNYVVKLDMFGFYLEETSPFSIGRIYGDSEKTTDRILRTYIDRDKNTGVLAVGAKGTGKTLLTKLVSVRAAEKHGIPTILVNDPHHGDGFNSFIASIEGRCLVLLDEFEKSYKPDVQESLLTLFDGVYQMNKLFLLTANDEYAVNKCMISRPGRIYYYLEYGPLERSFIEEYCRENLVNKSMIESVSDVADTYGNFSFDSLKSLIDEMNRYNEPPHAVLRYLNIRMDYFKKDRSYNLKVTRDGLGVEIDEEDDYPRNIDARQSRFTIDLASEDDSDDDDAKITIELRPDFVTSVRKGARIITWKTPSGYEVIATHVEPVKFDHLKSLASGYDQWSIE